MGIRSMALYKPCHAHFNITESSSSRFSLQDASHAFNRCCSPGFPTCLKSRQSGWSAHIQFWTFLTSITSHSTRTRGGCAFHPAQNSLQKACNKLQDYLINNGRQRAHHLQNDRLTSPGFISKIDRSTNSKQLHQQLGSIPTQKLAKCRRANPGATRHHGKT